MRTMNVGQNLEHKKLQSSIAMIVTLVSIAMLFASLFLSYSILRMNALVWPPMGFEKVSLNWPLTSTLFIALSSLAFEISRRSFEKSKMLQMRWSYYMTLLFGALFMFSQFKLWGHMNITGVYVESGIFASILHGFTWIHAAHVVCGIIALLFMYPLTRLESFESEKSIRVLNIGKFWHFLGLIWLVMFFVLFII